MTQTTAIGREGNALSQNFLNGFVKNSQGINGHGGAVHTPRHPWPATPLNMAPQIYRPQSENVGQKQAESKGQGTIPTLVFTE